MQLSIWPAVTLATGLLLVGATPVGALEPMPATTLPGISGMAPLDPGRAIAVHDAKSSEQDQPRVSLVTLADGPGGVVWQPVRIDWPAGSGLPHDLESASAIPGSELVLVAESGDDGSDFQRLFLLEVDPDADEGPTAAVAGVTEWPTPAFNVEGTAVGEVGGELALLWAERAQGNPMTTVQWAPLTLDPFEVGAHDGVDFTSPAVLSGSDRPVSAMEIGSGGIIHVAAAYETGDGAGPFSSSVWAIGAVVEGERGPVVELMPDPAIVAFADGFKVEGLAVLERPDGSRALHLGTDDEDFGGVLRPLPTE